MSKVLTILAITNDISLVKLLKERTKTFVSDVVFVPVSNGEKFADFASRYMPDAILVDDAFLDPLNAALVSKMRAILSTGASAQRPFFLLSPERSVGELSQIIANGFEDVFTKPVDPSLFYQKLQIHFRSHPFLKDKLLFSMDVDSRIGLAMTSKLVKASEYGATILCNRELHVGDLFVLTADMFGARSGDCLGRVMTCLRKPGDTSHFEATLLFVAPPKEVLSAIRLWIKQQYVQDRDTVA